MAGRLYVIAPRYAGQCATPHCLTRWSAGSGEIGYNPDGPKSLKCYCAECTRLIQTGAMQMGARRPSQPNSAPIPEPTPETPEETFENLPDNMGARESEQETEDPVPTSPDSAEEPLSTSADGKRSHKQWHLLLKIMRARDHHGQRMNIWIAGPAGSGKTTAARLGAEEEKLPFAFCGALTQTYVLFGFRDAQGVYQRTPFREVWENGGVFVLDDFDASDPVAAVELNALLANGHCAFPDGIVARHPDCVICLSANTWGHGATSDYVGRAKQDGAFLDRFVRLAWDYDEDLERALAPNHQKWVKRVQTIRERVRAKGLKILVTPRATVYGAALLEAGIPQKQVEALTIAAAMTPEQWQSIQ